MTATRKQGGPGRPFEKTMTRPGPQIRRRGFGPRYWMHERSGILRPAIEAYLAGAMTENEVAAMRAYLRQWIFAPVWRGGAAIEALRARIDGLGDRAAIAAWLADAAKQEVDPL
jgi:hypothetical protein